MEAGSREVDLTADGGGILLRLGGWDVRIRGPRAATRALRAVLSAVAIPEYDLPPLEIVISETGQAAGTLGGSEVWTLDLPKRGWLAPLLGYTVGTATSILRDLLFVHAGAVELQGRGYVLVGPAGAGKTSAASILVRNGAAYLSDEVALLDPAQGRLLPFALPLAVKPWTARAAGTFPPARQVASEGGVRYLLPSRRVSGSVPLHALILLDPGRPSREVADLPRAEMLLALSQHASSFRYRPRLEAAFSGFVRLLRGARCLSVGSASPADAAAAIAAPGGLPGETA